MGMFAKAKAKVAQQNLTLPDVKPTAEYPGGFGGKNFLSTRNI
jgi:hypothetical protein